MSNKNYLGDFEKGEIECHGNFDDSYTPLERPIRTDIMRPQFFEIEKHGGTSSDSDSSGQEPKDPKIQKTIESQKSTSQKPNPDKLKIWCHVLRDEFVAKNMTACNLDESQMKIRGLLPYPTHLMPEPPSGSGIGIAGKRNSEGQLVSEKKYFQDRFTYEKGCSKPILPLSKNFWDSDELLADEMAIKLDEGKAELILRAIQIAGQEKIKRIFNKTREIEHMGGMLVMNGSRRRTSGGVFFYLLKTSVDIPEEKIRQILYVDKRETAAQKKRYRKKNAALVCSTEAKKEDPGCKME